MLFVLILIREVIVDAISPSFQIESFLSIALSVPISGLIQIARLVNRHHVLDINKGVLAAIPLQDVQRLVYQVAQVHVVFLRIVNAVPTVHYKLRSEFSSILFHLVEDPFSHPLLTVLHFEFVEHGQQLSIEWHQGGAHQVRGHDQLLDYLQCDAHDLHVSSV